MEAVKDIPNPPSISIQPITLEERVEWLESCQQRRFREREQLITNVACIVFGFALALSLSRTFA